MNYVEQQSAGDALISLLRSTLSATGGQSFGHLVIYTSFGVVRGRTGLSFAQEMAAAEAGPEPTGQVIELNDVTVEHYSNHLPTATFDRLYIRLREVQGFALEDAQAEGL
ncbi:MAG TPA: hypothetical protein VFV34_20010 [Blastocatellia bacterium]|nr:hypothetical protein [Blastocatellia bacterium]